MAGTLVLGAGGCGFRPIHGEGGGAAAGDPAIAEELAATRVPLIAERFGQLLRRGLEQRLRTAGGGATPAPARWDLIVSPSFSGEALGIQRDGAATRVRFIATANWTLVRLAPREAVANGFERANDAFNIQPSQFFAADMSREAMERRLAEQLAEEVVTRVAIRFRGLQQGVPTRLIAPVETPPAPPEPIVAPRLGGPAVPLPGGAVGGGLDGGIGPTGIRR